MLPPKDMRLVISDNTPWINTGYIFIGLAVEGTGNTDIRIDCGGSCSCAAVSVADNNYDGRRYDGRITYDKGTGTLNYTRSDGLSVETIVSGCDFSQYNTMIWARQGDIQGNDLSSAVYNFTVESCEPDYQCSSFGSCNSSDLIPCEAVIDNNDCDVPYSGDYIEFATVCDFCTPSWSCSLLGECAKGDVKPCAAVQDANTCNESFIGNLSDFDGSCNYVSSSSNNGPYQFCTPEGECFESIEAYEKSTKPATLFAGGNLKTENPFSRFWNWLKNLLWEGEEWP